MFLSKQLFGRFEVSCTDRLAPESIMAPSRLAPNSKSICPHIHAQRDWFQLLVAD